MTKQITMDSVESSQIHGIGHDAATNTLAIRFKNRKTGAPTSLYHYSNFTAEDFAAFQAAESKGTHFGKYIKEFTEKYPFVKVESAPSAAQVIA